MLEFKFKFVDTTEGKVWNFLPQEVSKFGLANGDINDEGGWGLYEYMFALLNGEFSDIKMLQWAGLHDKNGKDIYEGDIVKGKYEVFPNKWKEYIPVEVIWEDNEAGFNIRGWDKLEILGNIYEDKNLLK